MDRYSTLGIAGHVDHGKTSLVRCLTGVDTDRRPDEKFRGLSIDMGVAPLMESSEGTIAVVDVPGHTDYLKNTIRGLCAVDMAILVVAADDGIMPQTREHLEILNFFQVRKGFVVLSKTDLVDQETLEIAMLEIEETLRGSFLEGCPILPFSAPTRAGLQAIRNRIQDMAGEPGMKLSEAPFRLWIDQVRVLKGFGTVVSGTVLSGKLCEDDTLQLLPAGIATRARSLESHGRKIQKAFPGRRVGINLHKVAVKNIARGMALTAPQGACAHHLLNAELRLLADAALVLKNRTRLKLHVGTAIINAVAVMMERETLGPGDTGLVQFRLATPAPVMPRDPFVISLMNRTTILGGGVILETMAKKYRKAQSVEIIPLLSALQNRALPAYLDSVFHPNQTRPFGASDLSAKTGWSRLEFEAAINVRVNKGALVYLKGMGAVDAAAWQGLKTRVLMVVERVFQSDPMKTSINEKEIADHLPADLETRFLQTVINDLCRDQKLKKGDGGFLNPLFDNGMPPGLPPEQEQMLQRLLEHARQIGLSPFSADSFWKHHQQKPDKPEIQKSLEFLAAANQLIRLRDNRFLLPAALEVIKERIKSAIETKGRITLKDSTEILGYGRWGGAPVFDYLDKIGFTLRIGDERIMRQ